MKRIASLILMAMLASILAACGGSTEPTTTTSTAPSAAANSGTEATSAEASAATGTSAEASVAASTEASASAEATTSASAATSASGSAAGGTGTTAATSCEPKGPKVDKLTFWTGAAEDSAEYPLIKAATDKYTQAVGTPVEIVSVPAEFKQKISISAPAGEGPDVFGPRAHDELGEYVVQKIALEIPESAIVNKDDILPVALQGVTVDGKIYALPAYTDNVGLFYNKDVVQTPPATWEEFTQIAKEDANGKEGLAFPVLEAYFTAPFFQGQGAYIFKYENGTYDITDIGFNKPEAVEAVKLLRDMYHKDQLLPEVAIDRQNMFTVIEGEFEAGNTAMTINGPWKEASFKTANLNYGVAKLPTLPNGNEMKPFLTVQMFVPSAFSKNPEAALDLTSFMTCTDTIVEMNQAFSKATVRQSALQPSIEQNPNIEFWAAGAADGLPMPNIPAMSQVWKPWNDAIDAVVVNNAPDDQVQGILDTAVEQIKAEIAKTQ